MLVPVFGGRVHRKVSGIMKITDGCAFELSNFEGTLNIHFKTTHQCRHRAQICIGMEFPRVSLKISCFVACRQMPWGSTTARRQRLHCRDQRRGPIWTALCSTAKASAEKLPKRSGSPTRKTARRLYFSLFLASWPSASVPLSFCNETLHRLISFLFFNIHFSSFIYYLSYFFFGDAGVRTVRMRDTLLQSRMIQWPRDEHAGFKRRVCAHPLFTPKTPSLL
jgi:hypothetical protein